MDDRDKRDFFRLNDVIQATYQRVTKTDVERAEPADFFTSDPNFHLLRDIYQLQMESTELLRVINDQNRQLGSFLHNLNARVELLAQGVVRQGTKEMNVVQEEETEISEGGVSFVCDELFDIGQNLALKLLFQPSQLGLTCFAEVRHCQLVDHDNQYRIGTRFIQPDYTTQRLISRHIIRRQSEQRRQRLHRESTFDDD